MQQISLFLALAVHGLAACLTSYALIKTTKPGMNFVWLKTFIVVQLAYTLVSVFQLFLYDESAHRIVLALSFLLLGSSPGLGLLFGLEFAGVLGRPARWMLAFLIPQSLTALFGLFPSTQSLVWVGVHYVHTGPFTVFTNDSWGAVASLYILCSYALSITGCFFVIHQCLRLPKIKRYSVWFMVVGVSFPLVCNAVFSAKLVPGWDKDYSCVALSFCALFLTLGARSYRGHKLTPMQRQDLLEHLNHGLLVVDTRGIIVDCNASAARLLACEEIQVLGKSMSEVRVPLDVQTREELILDESGGFAGSYFELRKREEIPTVVNPNEAAAVLSVGERRVVEQLGRNKSNKEIAEELSVSVHTVKYHLAKIYKKTGISSRTRIAARAQALLDGKVLNAGEEAHD